MDSAVIYEAFLSKVQADLLNYGYTRSGKSTLFYRYSADKKVGCCIEMQKSMFNLPDDYSFTFNFLCVGSYELNGYHDRRLTVSALKACLTRLLTKESEPYAAAGIIGGGSHPTF